MNIKSINEDVRILGLKLLQIDQIYKIYNSCDEIPIKEFSSISELLVWIDGYKACFISSVIKVT